MNKYVVFVEIVLLSVFACCSAIPIERIVNGTDAELGEIPYIISLRRNYRHSCGGSIVNSRCILTASHCVFGREPEDFSIQYGVLTISNDTTNSIDVEEIIMHEDYVSGDGWRNDVAVLKLNSSIPFSDTVYPVTLPLQGGEFPGWSDALLAGWGLPYTGGTVMDDLQRVDILLYPDDACEAAHYNVTSRAYHVCAGIPEGGKGQCNGDSGGPLTVGGVQAGIVSWSIKPCTIQGYPGVFSRVSSYVDWITEKCQD